MRAGVELFLLKKSNYFNLFSVFVLTSSYIRKRSITSVKLFIKIFLLSVFCLNAYAEDLSNRNISKSVLLHEDNLGRYYGTYVTHTSTNPNSWDQEGLRFRVIAVKKQTKNGHIIEITAKKITDYFGKPKDGYTINESEITLVNSKIIPSIKTKFPNVTITNIAINYYLDGYHFKSKRGGEYKSYDIEQSLFFLQYSYHPKTSTWRPSYEHELSKATGIDKVNIVPTVSAALASRKLLENEVTGRRVKFLAMFSEYEKRSAQNKLDRIQNQLKLMIESRKPGVVYKSDQFWEKYKGLETTRNILAGDFDFVESPHSFAKTYISYVEAYYHECEPYISSERVNYSAKWFETKYGKIINQTEYYVEMEIRFSKNYELLVDVKAGGDLAFFINSLSESISNRNKGKGFSFVGDTMDLIAQEEVTQEELGHFIKTEGCNSATVKQLADNLIASASGDEPVQSTGKRYKNANAESTSFDLADAQRAKDLKMRLSARLSKEGASGWNYFFERAKPYQTGWLANDGRQEIEKLHNAGKKLEGHPVLWCLYGPTGFNNDGSYRYEFYPFWYSELPEGIEAFLAARTQNEDINPGLFHALKDCPENSMEADKIISSN